MSNKLDNSAIQIIHVDYLNPQHEADLIHLLNIYAQDPMGGGKILPNSVSEHLCSQLSKIAGALSLIAYVNGQASALITCFKGFSTFRCQSLINVHDLMVIPEQRGRGLSQLLLNEVQVLAKQQGCCKITLEVLEGNMTAQHAYKKFGFSAYELDPKMGKALFWEKDI